MTSPRHPETSPWTTLSTREIYRNPWMRLREDQVVRPDGQPGIYGVVETRIATGVCALTPNDELYLVGQYRYPTERYSWEIIEGGGDPGETPLEAARRELREEAGLIAAHWEPLGHEFQLSNCISSEVGYIFIATGLTAVAAEPEGTEDLRIRRLPIAECLDMVLSGAISDAISIMAILMLARRP